MPPKSKGELTDAALMVLKKYLDCGMSKATTAKKLGRSYAYVYKYLTQPYVKNLLKMAMLEKNITFDRIATRISEGIDATKIQSCNVLVKQGDDGKYEINENSNDFIEVPDFFAREKYIKLALNIFEVGEVIAKDDGSTHLHFYNIKQIIEDANRANPDDIQDASFKRSEVLAGRPIKV